VSTPKTFAGATFNLPLNREPRSSNWGTETSNFLLSLADNAIPKTGGAYTLSAELNLGATYGLLLPYIKSATANIAATGIARLAVADTVAWRNNANSADLALAVNGSDKLTFNGVVLATAGAASIVNADIAAGAAIAYSKLALTGSIVNADVAAGAAIAYSKLALTGTILNADLAGSIAYSKLSLTGSVATADLAAGLLLPANQGGTGVANNAAATLTRAGNFGLTLTTTGTSSVTLPTAGTLSTLAGAEVITNKDHDGGTASNTSRLTVPSASLATLTALTRKQATLVYDTTAKALLADDGTNLNQIGGGSGEKNYITAPSTASAWTATGTITATTVTSGLPRPNTTKTGVSFAVGAAADYAYSRFTLDDADFNKKLKVQFDMVESVGTDWKVDVYSNTASNYSGTSTRLSLSTDASAVSLLPGLTGTYRTTFDAPGSAAKYIEIRIVRVANSSALVASDFIVGPGVVTQGAAVSGWTTQASYTSLTFAAITSPTRNQLVWRRVGANMEARLIWGGGSAVNSTANNVTFNMPAGYTIDSTALASTSQRDILGSGQWLSSGGTRGALFPVYGSSTTVIFQKQGGTTLIESDLGTGWELDFSISVPIAEWAGSGTVNVVQNDVEYVSNSSSTDAADTTSFAYGPTGSSIAPLTAARLKRVRFLTPVQATDKLFVEVMTSGGDWIDVAYSTYINGLCAFQYQNGNSYGIGLSASSVNATDIDVAFGVYGYASGATYGAAGTAWSGFSAYKWRVRKVSGGQAVGFSAVVPGVSSGLVPAAGLPGVTDNSSASSGTVGETFEASGAQTTVNGTYHQASSAQALTAGDWDVFASFMSAGATNLTSTEFCVGTTAGANTGTTAGKSKIIVSMPATLNSSTSGALQFRVNIAAGASYYVNCKSTGAADTVNWYFLARRRR
jgi:hypothetical protein